MHMHCLCQKISLKNFIYKKLPDWKDIRTYKHRYLDNPVNLFMVARVRTRRLKNGSEFTLENTWTNHSCFHYFCHFLPLFPFVLQGVSPLSYKSKSWNMQICVLIQENYIIFHYHRKRYFHFKVSLDIFNHILCRKR